MNIIISKKKKKVKNRIRNWQVQIKHLNYITENLSEKQTERFTKLRDITPLIVKNMLRVIQSQTF